MLIPTVCPIYLCVVYLSLTIYSLLQSLFCFLLFLYACITCSRTCARSTTSPRGVFVPFEFGDSNDRALQRRCGRFDKLDAKVRVVIQIHLTYYFLSSIFQIIHNTKEPEDMAKVRHAILVSLPRSPMNSLKTISIPPPFTLHEFLSDASGVSKVISTSLHH
jgi:hypothetical protein